MNRPSESPTAVEAKVEGCQGAKALLQRRESALLGGDLLVLADHAAGAAIQGHGPVVRLRDGLESLQGSEGARSIVDVLPSAVSFAFGNKSFPP